MSTATASSGPTTSLSDQAGRGPHGSLLRTETLRLRSRRMVRVLVALAVVGFVAVVVIASFEFAQPSAAGLADAAARRQAVFLDTQRGFASCLAAVGQTDGPATKEDCGSPTTIDQLGPLSDFVAKSAFTMAGPGRAGLLAVTGAVAALSFLLAATFVGAEWSTRSMVALLFWEPRRVRVIVAKLTVTGLATALLGVVAEAAWLVAAWALSVTRGTTAHPRGMWAELIGSAGRGVLLVVLVGWLGFGMANLLRHTAAALGVGFLYFAVVENAVRAIRPRWQPWLYTDNAIALLTTGGSRIYIDEGYVDRTGQYQQSGRELIVSNWHGGLVLAAVSAFVLALGIALFRRRDLN